jgi:V8-like Glu-specific endopeptidase
LRPVIVEGSPTDEFPAVGLFKTKTKPCTATLIGKRTVITAAHCIDDGEVPGQPYEHVFVLGGKEYAIEAAVRHPRFEVNKGDLTRMDPLDRAQNDIAIVRLKEAPPVQPATINASKLAMPIGLVIVGFGETRLNKDDRGVKRSTKNTVDRLVRDKLQFNGPNSVCHGDSGGPSFASIQGEILLVGIHSVVSNPCGSFGVDARVDAYLSFIKEASGGDVQIGPAAR